MCRLVSAYQKIVRERLNVALAMAGLSAVVVAMLNGSVLTFLNPANKVKIGPLALCDIEVFY